MKGKANMNNQFSSGQARLPKRTLRVIVMIVLMAVVAIFGAFSFTSSAYAVSTVEFVLPNGNVYSYLCASGSQGQIDPSLTGPESAINNCKWRVWLYQNAAHTGTALCVSPFTATGTLHTRWEYYRISSNTSRCS